MDRDPPIDTWARLAALVQAARLIVLIDGGAPEEEVERLLRRLTADQRAQLRTAMDDFLGDEPHGTQRAGVATRGYRVRRTPLG